MNIDKDILKALMLFAPKNDVRYYLNGVNVKAKDGKLRLTASDGYTLATACLDADGTESEDAIDIILPYDAVKTALGVKRPKAENTLHLDIKRSLIGGVHYTPVDGRYPDWHKIWPEECAPRGALSPRVFDPRLLTRVGQAMDIIHGKDKGEYMLWHSKDGNTQVYEIGPLLCVIMCRGESVRTVRMPRVSN